jgi:hypothetical protein
MPEVWPNLVGARQNRSEEWRQTERLNHRESSSWSIEVNLKIVMSTPVSSDLGLTVGFRTGGLNYPDLSLVDSDVAADEARHLGRCELEQTTQ